MLCVHVNIENRWKINNSTFSLKYLSNDPGQFVRSSLLPFSKLYKDEKASLIMPLRIFKLPLNHRFKRFTSNGDGLIQLICNRVRFGNGSSTGVNDISICSCQLKLERVWFEEYWEIVDKEKWRKRWMEMKRKRNLK